MMLSILLLLNIVWNVAFVRPSVLLRRTKKRKTLTPVDAWSPLASSVSPIACCMPMRGIGIAMRRTSIVLLSLVLSCMYCSYAVTAVRAPISVYLRKSCWKKKGKESLYVILYFTFNSVFYFRVLLAIRVLFLFVILIFKNLLVLLSSRYYLS